MQPPSRFGELIIDSDGLAREFVEKPQTSEGAINGGFMVFEREAIDKYFPHRCGRDARARAAEWTGLRRAVGRFRASRLLAVRRHATGALAARRPVDVTGQAPWQTWS